MEPPTNKPVVKPIEFLMRNEWSALPPKWTKPLELPVTKIFLAMTKRPMCISVRQCFNELQKTQRYHMSVDTIGDIRYNFLISATGTVFEGRGWRFCPDLPLLYSCLNKNSLFIGFMGDYGDSKDPVPSKMLESMDRLFRIGIEGKYVAPDYETFDL